MMILKIIFSRIAKSNLTYSIKQIIILHKNLSIFIIATFLLVSLIRAEVQDMVIFTDGNAIIGQVLAVTDDSLIYASRTTATQQSAALKSIYYAYNDFGKILYISRSLHNRMTYLEHYSGLLTTVQGDSILFDTIYFDRQMSDPLVYITTAESIRPIKLPFLEVESVRMSTDRLNVSVKRACFSSCGLVLFMSGLRTLKYFKDNYTGDGLFSGSSMTTLLNSVTASVQDVLPEADIIGSNRTGSAYHFTTVLFPIMTMGWIGYDWFFDRRTVYINPLRTDRTFPEDMFLFSLKEWSNVTFSRFWTPLSRTILDGIYRTRKAIWKG